MTRSELITQMSARFPDLSDEIVKKSVDLILQDISDTLALGRRVEIRGFGSFSLHRRSSGIGRNPRTGEAVSLIERRIPYFKPGKELRERVNDSRTRDLESND